MQRTKINLESINRELHSPQVDSVDEVLKKYGQYRLILATFKKEVCDKQEL